MPDRKHSRSIQANLIAGVLTVIPLVVVWVVLNFISGILFVSISASPRPSMFMAEREAKWPRPRLRLRVSMPATA